MLELILSFCAGASLIVFNRAALRLLRPLLRSKSNIVAVGAVMFAALGAIGLSMSFMLIIGRDQPWDEHYLYAYVLGVLVSLVVNQKEWLWRQAP
jgi:hypothetical protein